MAKVIQRSIIGNSMRVPLRIGYLCDMRRENINDKAQKWQYIGRNYENAMGDKRRKYEKKNINRK